MEDQTPKSRIGARGILLIFAAIGILVLPVIFGILISRDTGSSDTGDGAMGGSDTTATAAMASVRDLDEILEGPVSVEPDPSGTAAVVRAETAIDVVCAVSFGPDSTLGGLATDDDMGGGGHRNHHPVLTSLEPGVTYLYRITGIAADGTVYQSDTMEFTMPGSAAAGTNLALGGTVVEVSSEYSATYAASNAFDGSLSTEWSSNGDGDEAFITIDLGTPMSVTGVGLRTREMSDGTSITTAFTVTVDAQTYGPFESGPGLSAVDLDVTGQVFRFDVDTSTGGNTGAVEIEIYG